MNVYDLFVTFYSVVGYTRSTVLMQYYIFWYTAATTRHKQLLLMMDISPNRWAVVYFDNISNMSAIKKNEATSEPNKSNWNRLINTLIYRARVFFLLLQTTLLSFIINLFSIIHNDYVTLELWYCSVVICVWVYVRVCACAKLGNIYDDHSRNTHLLWLSCQRYFHWRGVLIYSTIVIVPVVC